MTDRLDDLKAALQGRYEIEGELGHGGMATVYLAKDIRHHRQVAVKVLRPDLAAALGPERFLREIRIAANLTHPHILPLHDSGEAEGFLYYVMPYIKGQTLRDRIDKEGELPVAEAVRIIREVTDALAFAHSQGVVHRDIKPDNVMLTGGHAIVADFGVAKAVSEATGRDKLTTAGVALGTPAYMSPEQATADPHVDHRADIYAVGAMAYEVLAGRTPFTGATPQSVLAAHVTEQPDPVSKHRDQVSGELEAVIMKCLAKKPADRWQSADEMLPYLDASATPSGGLTPAGTRPVEAVSGTRKLFSPMMLAGVAVLVVIVVFGSRMMQPAPLTITVTNERQITFDLGLEFEPSLSPDGSKVVYSKGAQFRTHPFVQVLSGGATVPLAGDLAGYQRGSMWNTAGDSVVFWHWNATTPQPGWASTAMLGGAVRTLDLVAERDKIAWSRDGANVAYGRGDSLFVRTQGNERLLLVTPDGLAGPRHLAWSPDGRRIAYVIGANDWNNDDILGDIFASSIWAVDAEDGGAVLVVGADGFNMNVSPVWTADGHHILFVSDREASRAVYLVEVGKNGPEESPQRVPGGGDPHSISISDDGGRLAYAKFNYTRNIFEYRLVADGVALLSEGKQLTRGTEIIERIEISPNGEWIAFDSHINGNHDVFKMRPDGSGRTQLTSDLSDNFLGKWSPDGSELSVTARIGNVNGSGIVSADGSSDAVRSFRNSEWGTWSRAFWSPTGLEILLGGRSGSGLWMSSRENVGALWSEPVPVGESLPCADWSEWSPGSDMILCSSSDAGTVVLLATRAGEPLWSYLPDASAGEPWLARAQFSADGSTIYAYGVAPDGTQGVWAMPTTGGKPKLVIVNDDESLWANVFSFEVGPDDRIYLAVAEYQSDIWVMDLEY